MEVQHTTKRIVRDGKAYNELKVTTIETVEIPIPDTSHLITEDENPVDNIFSEQQQRLLVETLRNSSEAWNEAGRTFVVMANVGLFASLKNPAIVPDVLLSMDVELPHDEEQRVDYAYLRSYFSWEFGKMPDVVIEIVSNRKGKEMSKKMLDYAQMHIPYYVVFDPFGEMTKEMDGESLLIYELHGSSYLPMKDFWLESVGLGIRLWDGVYEDARTHWLRWCDARGKVIPTGKERGDAEQARAEQEKSRAEQEKSRADTAESRAERLAEQLRALGIHPEV